MIRTLAGQEVSQSTCIKQCEAHKRVKAAHLSGSLAYTDTVCTYSTTHKHTLTHTAPSRGLDKAHSSIYCLIAQRGRCLTGWTTAELSVLLLSVFLWFTDICSHFAYLCSLCIFRREEYPLVSKIVNVDEQISAGFNCFQKILKAGVSCYSNLFANLKWPQKMWFIWLTVMCK